MELEIWNNHSVTWCNRFKISH